MSDAPSTWDADVLAGLEGIGEQVASAVAPLAAAFQATRAERDAATAALGDLLGFLERHAVRPNWAQDRATLESARDVHRRLTERTTHDGTTDGTEGHRAERPAGGPEGPDGRGSGDDPGAPWGLGRP